MLKSSAVNCAQLFTILPRDAYAIQCHSSILVLQEVTKKDEHQLMLSRLEWELEQRKQ